MDLLRRILRLPETNVAMFAFLLNYPWEFLQVPFFEGMSGAPHWQAVKTCTVAALGDAVIALLAFWIAAAASRGRDWVLDARAPEVLAFTAIGLVITGVIERVEVMRGAWNYSELMPILPLIQIGVVPILQWLMLPPLVLWFVRRQIT